MRLSTVESPPPTGDPGSANEHFRRRDRRRLSVSASVSAAIHVLLVLAWPELSPSSLDPGVPAGTTALEMVAVAPARPPGQGLVALPLAPEEDASSVQEADEEEAEGREDGNEGNRTTRGDRRAEALERIAAVRPGVVRRPPDPPSDPPPEASTDDEITDAEASEDDDVRIRAASSRLHGRLSEEELLRLERMASVRPELAFGSTSSWLVLQNPAAVTDFMRRRFGRGRAGGPDHGRLSVSLWVDERGSIEWAEINVSSGRRDLDEAALELFDDVVQFTPARNQGMGVATAAVFWLQW